MQKDFNNPCAVLIQIPFKACNLFIAVFKQCTGEAALRQIGVFVQAVHFYNQHIFVIGAVKNTDTAPGRKMAECPPEIIMVQLFGTRLFEIMHGNPLRVHTGDDMFDGAVFSGGIHGLKNN